MTTVHLTSFWRRYCLPNHLLNYDVPVGGRAARRPLPDDAGPVQQPLIDGARGVAPENVGLAILVEVAHTHDLPVGAGPTGRARADHTGPVQLPYVEGARGVMAPENVGLAIP